MQLYSGEYKFVAQLRFCFSCYENCVGLARVKFSMLNSQFTFRQVDLLPFTWPGTKGNSMYWVQQFSPEEGRRAGCLNTAL